MNDEPTSRPSDQKDGLATRGVPRLLESYPVLVARLYAESGALSWTLSRERFEAALERSARKGFGDGRPIVESQLEEYLGALHLSDLALASACADGSSDAWEHFVRTYRGYLRSAAAGILRCPAGSAAAYELADSLFAELFGLGGGKNGERSVFHYFHGRSSLKTWLRAILAQRHVDAIRAGRRFVELPDDDLPDQRAGRRVAQASQPSIDPHRERYVALFTRALETALSRLDPRNKRRLQMYYADEKTLAEIGRSLGEHESSASRNLERTRREVRAGVEEILRKGGGAVDGAAISGLSEAEISLCFEYASEDAPVDLGKLLPGTGRRETKPERQP
jgi:RNA polymerase sigma factor (sigma-70 family)